jgi:protease PrsW
MFLIFIEKYPFVLSFILGLIPALLWLWFWLKEDIHPEPAKMVTLSFFGGMVSVLVVLEVQKFIYTQVGSHLTLSFFLWAATEEIFKFLFVYFIALQNKSTDEPIDDIIYLIVSALGFVTLENTLFLIPMIGGGGDILDTVISGNLRFIGASLLHVMSSATIGICMALAFYKSLRKKIAYTLIGIAIAIVLHTSFNLFIINGAPGDIFFIFGTVWIGIILLLLLFEKVKHIRNPKVL